MPSSVKRWAGTGSGGPTMVHRPDRRERSTSCIGIPVWATLLGFGGGRFHAARRRFGPLRLGVAGGAERGEGRSQPAPQGRAERVHVSSVAALSGSGISSASIADFPEPERVVELASKSEAGPVDLGIFWSHMLVAEGACEVGLDPVVSVLGHRPPPGDRRRSRRKVHGFRGDKAPRRWQCPLEQRPGP